MSEDEIKSVEGFPLSAEYRNATEGEIKLDFEAKRFDYKKEGYSFYHHPIYKNAEDTIMSNYSRLDLTDKLKMSDGMAVNGTMNQADLIIYTMLKTHNGNYLHVDGDKIYADEAPKKMEAYDSSYMFKIIKTKYGYFEVMNGDKYCHVNPENLNVELSDKPAGDTQQFYRFNITQYGNSNRILINSMMIHPWGMVFDHPFGEDHRIVQNATQEFGNRDTYPVDIHEKGPDGEDRYPPSNPRRETMTYTGVKRFWTIYDGLMNKLLYDGKHPNMVKCIGVLWKNLRKNQPDENYYYNNAIVRHEQNRDKWTGDNQTYVNASNNYIFLVDNGTGDDEKAFLIGYNGKIRWVQYHNEFFNKVFNRTLTPKEIVDEVAPNFLTDVPYETQFDSLPEHEQIEFLMKAKKQKIDLTQGKNILTPNREFARKADQ